MKRMYETQDGTFIDLMGVQAIEREDGRVFVKHESFPEWKRLESPKDHACANDWYYEFVKLVDEVKCGKVWIP